MVGSRPVPSLGLPASAFHFVDAANWPGVQARGLFPASALLAGDPELRGFRARSVTTRDGVLVRDQAPMPPTAVDRCLDPPLRAADWYDLVNQGVYFWLDPERAERHAAALRGRPQVMLTIDAIRLLDCYALDAFVTPFNVGAARRRPARRGLRTFVPVARWRQDVWAHEALPGADPRSRSHPPAELVIRSPIPDLMSYVIRVRLPDDDPYSA